MLHATDIFGRPRYRNHLGMAWKSVSGVSVRVLQLVDNLDERAVASVVFHDNTEVDRIHAPAYAPLVAEWVASLPA